MVRGDAPEAAPPPLAAPEEKSRTLRRFVLAGVAALVIGLGAGWFFGRSDDGDDDPGPAAVTTTTEALAGGLGPCPAAQATIPSVDATGTELAAEVAVEPDGQTARVSWADTNDGQAVYVVLMPCPGDAEPAVVGATALGDDPEVVVEGLSTYENYCFGVATVIPGPKTLQRATVDDEGHHYVCLDDTVR